MRDCPITESSIDEADRIPSAREQVGRTNPIRPAWELRLLRRFLSDHTSTDRTRQRVLKRTFACVISATGLTEAGEPSADRLWRSRSDGPGNGSSMVPTNCIAATQIKLKSENCQYLSTLALDLVRHLALESSGVSRKVRKQRVMGRKRPRRVRAHCLDSAHFERPVPSSIIARSEWEHDRGYERPASRLCQSAV